MSPLGRHVDRLALFDDRLGLQAECDQIGDRDDFQTVFLRDLMQLGQARHRAVLVHDFDQRPAGRQSGHAGQVDDRLGMAGTAQHAAFARPERKYVSGAAQFFGLRGRIDQRADRLGPVGHGDSGRASLRSQVDRDGERGFVQRRVVGDHHRQVQLLAARFGQRSADQPAPVGRHEIDDFGRDLFAGDDEVALVLAVLVVDHDQYPACPDLLDRFLYGTQYSLLRLFGCHIESLCLFSVFRNWLCRREAILPGGHSAGKGSGRKH